MSTVPSARAYLEDARRLGMVALFDENGRCVGMIDRDVYAREISIVARDDGIAFGQILRGRAAH